MNYISPSFVIHSAFVLFAQPTRISIPSSGIGSVPFEFKAAMLMFMGE